jgi:hypothetical protein
MDGVDPGKNFFGRLAGATGDIASDAPSRLKSRIYSALVREAQAQGPLCTLTESQAAGRGLCVFEGLVSILPATGVQQKNPCAVCHARVLAEHFENAPIYWPNCPYVRFQNR